VNTPRHAVTCWDTFIAVLFGDITNMVMVQNTGYM